MMTAQELDAFVRAAFPDRDIYNVVEEVTDDRLVLRMPADAAMLRPGGTVSGPSLMGLADQAAYLMIAAVVGPEALAVTTNLSISFLRRPYPGDVLAIATPLSIGRRVAVVDVRMRSLAAGHERDVAAAQVTYQRALPDGTQGGPATRG